MTKHVIALLAAILLSPLAFAQDDSDVKLFKAQQTIAEKGDASAQYFLGEMYEQGLGTEQNLAEAFRWYEKSAQQGYPMAQQKLGRRQAIEQQHASDRAARESANRQEMAAQERERKRAAIRTMIQNRARTHREAFE